MVTKSRKDDYIKIRVTSEQKKKLKEIAKAKNISMSEIIVNLLEQELQVYSERKSSYNKIKDRVVATEGKIEKLKKKLLEKNSRYKKNNIFKFFK